MQDECTDMMNNLLFEECDDMQRRASSLHPSCDFFSPGKFLIGSSS